MNKLVQNKYSENLIEALNKIQFPIEDKKHNLLVYLDNNMARSNQTRLEHITSTRHRLTVKDIESIPQGIKKESRLRKDPFKKSTFNYYFQRKSNKKEYIKISVLIDKVDKKKVTIKTIFITKHMK